MKVKLANENFKEDFGANLLRARGVTDINSFLNPTQACLQTYKDLENIDKAVELIKNLKPDGKVALVVDCDVDGFTSAAIIYQYLKTIIPTISIKYFLHNGKQHGLEDCYDEILYGCFDLLIIPDAGSNDSEYAEKVMCNTLVIDHHLVENTNFCESMVVVNNQISPKYQNKDLSGAGMVYQFCRALDEAFGVNLSEEYIDLAATGICADMMNVLQYENQYIFKKGFAKINNYFLLTIARKQSYSITNKMGCSDEDLFSYLNPISVAFYIVPLINAMIRVGTPEEKERLFLAFINGHVKIASQKRGAKGTLEEVAVESVRECVNARTHQNKIKDEAVERIEEKIEKHNLLNNKILFIKLDDKDTLPSELNGLLAMQLSAKYKKPTMVGRINNEGMLRGSIRGVANCELTSFKDYLTSTGLLEYVQGHDNAAGYSISADKLGELHNKANIDLAQYDFGNSYYEVNFQRCANEQDISNLVEDLYSYRNVWGQSNNEALIYITDLYFTMKDVQIMGKNADTIKIVKNGVAYMKFFAKEMIEELKSLNTDKFKMELVGKANMNFWMGRSTPQIFIENYEIKKDNLLDF